MDYSIVIILSFSFKQQIVFYPDVTATRLIGMKVPPIPLDVFNAFSYLPVIINLYTPPLFHPCSPPENLTSMRDVSTFTKKMCLFQ